MVKKESKIVEEWDVHLTLLKEKLKEKEKRKIQRRKKRYYGKEN